MDPEDITENVLAGLPDDYKPEIDAIHGRETAIPFAELHERLLNREAMLICKEPTASLDAPITANATDARPRNTNTQNNWRGPNRNHNNRQYSNHGSYNSNQRAYNSNQGAYNQGSYNRGSRPYLGRCQACGIQSHSTKNCPKYQIIRGNNTSQPWRQQPQSQTWNPRANVAMMNGDSSTWLLDSGASHHMTYDIANLSLHTPYNGGDDVILRDGSGLNISHTGSLTLPSLKHPFFIYNVLYVPALDKNLISVFQLCTTNGVAVTFTPTYFQVRDLNTGALCLEDKPDKGTYQWPKAPGSNPPSLSFASVTTTTLPDWHSRLGHPATSILQTMISKFHLPLASKDLRNKPCNACSINKMHKLPFSVSTLTSSSPLEIVFSDVWTSPLLSIDNFKYYVIFVDHFTRFSWLYPLKRKSQVSEVFQRFKALVENRFHSKIRTLYTDNGGEYIALTAFLAANGISHYTSSPYTPEHNGISERKHRHIVETGLALLSHASVPKSYWPYALSMAVFLINRMPTPVINMILPFERLFGSVPNYSKLRIFGCLCFPWTRPYSTNKFDSRSTPCIFLGYSTIQSAYYYCLDRITSRIYTSRHVVFHEYVFPFELPNSLTSESSVENVNAEHTPADRTSTTVIPIHPPTLFRVLLLTMNQPQQYQYSQYHYPPFHKDLLRLQQLQLMKQDRLRLHQY